MHYRTLGRTELRVSEIGFGAWAIGGNQFGNSYGPTDDANSLQAVRRALDLGCNFYDTADVYGHGHSEELLGRALYDVRDETIVATKVGGSYMYAEERLGHVNFSEEYIRFACEESLKRLRREAIDIYQLHNPPYDIISTGEVFEPLVRLKEEGKVRFIGISVFEMLGGLDAIRWGVVDCIQISCNLFEQRLRSGRSEILRLAEQAGVGVIVREPLGNGFLTGKYSADTQFAPGDIRCKMFTSQMIEERAEVATKLQFLAVDGKRTLAQAALRFCLMDHAVSVAIPGAKTKEQVEENCGASYVPHLTKEDLRAAQCVLC